MALHFVELDFNATGDRVFSVLINGVDVFRDFDIIDEVGQRLSWLTVGACWIYAPSATRTYLYHVCMHGPSEC